jgi:hypothetical protein
MTFYSSRVKPLNDSSGQGVFPVICCRCREQEIIESTKVQFSTEYPGKITWIMVKSNVLTPTIFQEKLIRCAISEDTSGKFVM